MKTNNSTDGARRLIQALPGKTQLNKSQQTKAAEDAVTSSNAKGSLGSQAAVVSLNKSKIDTDGDEAAARQRKLESIKSEIKAGKFFDNRSSSDIAAKFLLNI